MNTLQIKKIRKSKLLKLKLNGISKSHRTSRFFSRKKKLKNFLKKKNIKNFLKYYFDLKSKKKEKDCSISYLEFSSLYLNPSSKGLLINSNRNARILNKSIYSRKNALKYRLRIKWFFFINTSKLYKNYYKKGKLNFNYLDRRLDAFISNNVLNLSILKVRQYIKHGHFVVNGKPCNTPGQILKFGDIIQVHNKSNLYTSIVSFENCFSDMVDTILRNNIVEWVLTITDLYKKKNLVENDEIAPFVRLMYIQIGLLIGRRSRKMMSNNNKHDNARINGRDRIIKNIEHSNAVIFDMRTMSFLVTTACKEKNTKIRSTFR